MRYKPAPRLTLRGLRKIPGLWIADTYRSRNSLGVGNNLAMHKRRSPRCLTANHDGEFIEVAGLMILGISQPIGADIACITHRKKVVIGRSAQAVHDLKSCSLLPLQTVGIDRIDQCHRCLVGHRFHYLHSFIKVPGDLNDPGPVHHGLGQFAKRYHPIWNHNECLHTRPGSIGRSRCRRITGGRTDDRFTSLIGRHRNRDRHSPILE